jgi:hypothetical protein
VIRRAAAMAIAVAVATGGCSRGPTFTRDDVPKIMLRAADAPAGTTFAPGFSGEQQVDAFATDANEARLLKADGFEIGYGSLFLPPGATTGPVPPGSPFVQSIAGLFTGADGASSALHRFVDDLGTRQIPGAKDLDAGSLGDEAFALQGTGSGGDHVVVFAWREGNLVLAVTGSGSVPAAEVQRLAHVVDGRAVAL